MAAVQPPMISNAAGTWRTDLVVDFPFRLSLWEA